MVLFFKKEPLPSSSRNTQTQTAARAPQTPSADAPAPATGTRSSPRPMDQRFDPCPVRPPATHLAAAPTRTPPAPRRPHSRSRHSRGWHRNTRVRSRPRSPRSVARCAAAGRPNGPAQGPHPGSNMSRPIAPRPGDLPHRRGNNRPATPCRQGVPRTAARPHAGTAVPERAPPEGRRATRHFRDGRVIAGLSCSSARGHRA